MESGLKGIMMVSLCSTDTQSNIGSKLLSVVGAVTPAESTREPASNG